jgi:putative tryptophan/tyrosine transport system substrate-binding protein
MRRREFIAVVSGAAVWPVAARAQQHVLPAIGFLSPGSPDADLRRLGGVRQGLKEVGYIDGQNVTIEYRGAGGQIDRLPALAADLVRREVAVIIAVAATATNAAKDATTTIPIVFDVGVDPVAEGFVTSLNRPGGNVTGVLVLSVELVAKRLQILHELLPTAAVVALLVNPTNRFVTEPETKIVQETARSLGLQLHLLQASSTVDIDAAFEKLVEVRAGGLVVSVDPFLTNRTAQIVALAARHAVPTIYGWRESAMAGGLMSYGTSLDDSYRQTGIYVARILKGDKPTDLPVQQMVKVEMILNLKTAKALGLAFPVTLLGRADEVIE